MILRFLLPFLSDYLRSNTFKSKDNQESLVLLKGSVSREISAQLFKVFAGVVLAGLIILALAKFFTALNLYIEQFENPLLFQIITFGLLALLGAGLLCFLFLGEKFKAAKVAAQQPPRPHQSDIQSVFLKFIDGVSAGFEKNKTSKNRESRAL